MTIAECSFGMIEVEFPGGKITPAGLVLQGHKFTKFLTSIRLPKSKKQVLNEEQTNKVNYNSGAWKGDD